MNLLKHKKQLDELYDILQDIGHDGLKNAYWEKVKNWIKKNDGNLN